LIVKDLLTELLMCHAGFQAHCLCWGCGTKAVHPLILSCTTVGCSPFPAAPASLSRLQLVASAAQGECVPLLRPEGQSEPAPPESDSDSEQIVAASRIMVLRMSCQGRGPRMTQPRLLVTTGSVSISQRQGIPGVNVSTARQIASVMSW
jgi:hypothetical protein